MQEQRERRKEKKRDLSAFMGDVGIIKDIIIYSQRSLQRTFFIIMRSWREAIKKKCQKIKSFSREVRSRSIARLLEMRVHAKVHEITWASA